LQWASNTRQQLNVEYEVILWMTNDPLRCFADNRRVLEPHTERHLQLLAAGGEKRSTNHGDGAYRLRAGRSFAHTTPGRIPRNVLQFTQHGTEISALRQSARSLGLPVHGALMPLALATFLIKFLIQINAMTNAAEVREGGFASSPEQVRELESRFRENYPKFNFSMVTALVDRAGRLPTIKNARAIMMPGEKVVGCGHSSTHDSGSKGDVFLCCDDYSMEYTFGNLLTQSLDEIWLSERHVDTILKAFGELCTKCQHHKVGTAAQPGVSRLRQRVELFTVFSAGVRGPELKLLPAAPGPAREREPA
jgi:hypothetical protein